MTTATFGRVLTAMVTPFTDDGALDLDAAANLAKWLVDEQKNEGLVLAGTTGESPTLTHDEQGELFRVVRAAVDVPIVAGTGSNSTAEAIDLTERAKAAGADGILVVTPYYNRPSQAALHDHFTQVAKAAEGLPMVVYDIPVRTGRKVDTEVLLELAHDVPNIIGIKDAAGDPGETAQLLAEAPEGFEIYSGDDSLTLPFLSIGAVGAIGVATHWCGVEHVAMFDAYEAGDVTKARELNLMMQPSFRFETGLIAPNPVPTKAMMRMLGHSVGRGRPPMHIEPPGLEAAARAIIEDSGLAVEAQLSA